MNAVPIDRRTFIARLSLLTGGLAAAGGTAWCVLRPSGQPEDTGRLPFAVWREIREALRTSPDHLSARVEELVAAGDAAAIFAFVRDSVATCPSTATAIRADRGMSWGVRGTLRSGAGTPREKAELLAELYRRAGWNAEVVIGAVPTSVEATRELMCRRPTRPFAPRIEPARLARWRTRLELPPTPERPLAVVDPDGTACAALAAAIARQLPEPGRLTPFDWRFGNMPLVRATKGDDAIHANLFAPDVPFGEAGVDPARLRPAPPPDPLPDVRVSLAMAVTSDPDTRVPLIEGQWPLADLVGRQVLARMVPVMDMATLATATFQDVRLFVPSLTVQAVGEDSATHADWMVLGDAITRDGVRVTETAGGGVALDGREVIPPTPGAIVAAVASLAIRVNASRFPTIRVDVSARDVAGALVEGLDARAFTVHDDDHPAPFFLRASRAAPRIELLVDQSGSMPSAYRGEAMDALTARLSARIREVYPHAEIRLRPTDSSLWTWVGRAAGTDANLIVLATDGHRNDELTPSVKAAVDAGPPVVVINVRNYAPNNFWYRHSLGPIAEATGGIVVPVRQEDDIDRALIDYLRTSLLDLPPYTLDYHVPVPGPGEHRVTVRTSDARVVAEARYTVPADPAVPPDVCGLYLTVTVGKEAVTRTLAGYDANTHGRQHATREMVTSTLGVLFGEQIVSFEGAAPTMSAWLDDFITAKLAVESLHDAAAQRDQAALAAALDTALPVFPSDLLLQTTPIGSAADGDALTFAVGPRVMLARTRPILGTDRYAHGIDILPFTRFATAAADPFDAFTRTLAATARLAVAEDAAFETSTLSRLRDVPLVTLTASVPRRGYQLVPADGPPLAFWTVDAQTGSLIGVVGSGSGGARQAGRMGAVLRPQDRVMSQYARLQSMGAGPVLTPICGFALGVAAIHGPSLQRVDSGTSLPLAQLEASRLPDTLAFEVQRLTCEVMKTTFTSVHGPLDGRLGTLELLMGAIGGDGPFTC